MFTRLIILLFLACLASTTQAATFTVSNNNDSGAGSLRAAITALNAAAGGEHILEFNGDYTITLASTLPSIQRQVFINAVSPRNVRITANSLISAPALNFVDTSDGSIVQGIEISCVLAGGCFDIGVTLSRPGILVWNMVIDGMRLEGVRVNPNAANTSISNVRAINNGRIGSGGLSQRSGLHCTQADGLDIFNGSVFGLTAANAAAGNSGDGIHLDRCTNVLVSGVTTASNGSRGISIAGGSNITLRGNRIGTTPDGVTARGNGSSGILLNAFSATTVISGVEIGGTLESHRNIIAANGATQVLVQASGGNTLSGLLIRRNTIGSNINGAAVGSAGSGVLIASTDVIDPQVGEPAHPNVIANNAAWGVQVNGSPAPRVRISRNSLFANGSGAITTTESLSAPVITTVTGLTGASGTAPIPPGGATGTVELFADDANQAEHFIASSSVSGSGTWSMVGLSLGTHSGRNLRATYTQVQSGTFRTTRLSTNGATVGGYSLGVSKTGSGAGTVTSSPSGINCGATCSANFHHGTEVTLTAAAAAGSDFTGWTVSGGVVSGCGAVSTTCTLSMTQARTASASFTAHNLVVTRSGSGIGTVNSSPGGISCGSTCSHLFGNGTVVTLTATPSGGSTFTGWSGSGCSGTGTCVVTISAIHTVNAQFAITQHSLGVSKTGNAAASGTVTSNPAGINCGATCSANFNFDTSVTLTATPGPNTHFTGWSGAGCSGTGTCVVVLSGDRNVSAGFSIDRHTLTVTNGGGGTVTSNPAGINCGGTCSADYDHGTSVELTATPLAGRTFAGWTGSCAGAGACIVSMTQARSVGASFTLNSYTVNVSKPGNGSGTVSTTPAGIDCGATCSAQFDHGTSLILSASPSPGSVFAGWNGTGACDGSTSTSCGSFLLTGPLNVTATFNLQQHTLTVSSTGSGSGTVSSDPVGISCGSTCSAQFNHGTSVTLTATPAVGSSFVEWNGACTGSGPCVVSMTQAQGVNATFAIDTHTLSVSKSGAGTGTVTSSPLGINCGATCSTQFNHGTVVTLSATPAAGSAFTGWTGSFCGGTGTCIVDMNAARSVNANFEIQTFTVNVFRNGQGSVSSNPAGIDCGSACSADFTDGTALELSATAEAGWRFVGWSGDCSGTLAQCQLTVSGVRNVQASFVEDVPDMFALQVGLSGTGGGNVSSNPAGIDCGPGAACTANFVEGSMVTLTASPQVGSEFIGWSGACIGNALTCELSMTTDRNVSAQFSLTAAPQFSLSVQRVGSGQVVSNPVGIDCGAVCQASFDEGQLVTLLPTPALGWTFSHWSGDCAGSGACSVTLDADAEVSATFVEQSATEVLVEFSGSGSGRVTSNPAGIDCGSDDVGDCIGEFDSGVSITLTAEADPGSSFTSWSGDCSGSGDCVLQAGGSYGVTARFLLDGELEEEIFASGFED